MKILHYDLETAPSMAYVWKLWKENVGINQLLEAGRVITWCAKWDGDEDIYGMSEFHDGHEEMINGLYVMMEEADVIVAYNGNNFDRPVMNAEFLKYGLGPPPPSKQVDLYQVVKRQFKLISNRLAYVAQYLDIEQKAETGGFQLWADCLAGDPDAWEQMMDYNAQDVVVLEELYHKLRAWIPNHPNHALYTPAGGERICPSCGSTHVQSRGTTKTSTMTYRRYQCMDCKTWSRERLAERAAEKPNLVRDNTK